MPSPVPSASGPSGTAAEALADHLEGDASTSAPPPLPPKSLLPSSAESVGPYPGLVPRHRPLALPDHLVMRGTAGSELVGSRSVGVSLTDSSSVMSSEDLLGGGSGAPPLSAGVEPRDRAISATDRRGRLVGGAGIRPGSWMGA